MSKILVIEDDNAVRSLLAGALRLKSFEVVVAEDGEHGTRLAKEMGPDLIICDIRMPRMDGFKTLEVLRSDPLTATIPFIFLTGYSERSDLRQAMELGADDYLTKPFTVKELLAAVNTRLSKRKEVLRRSDQRLEELRANLTLALPHELLTPLNGINGLAELLIQENTTLSADEVKEYATGIRESAQRLQRLVENFLIYSNIELAASNGGGGQVLRPIPALALREIVAEIVQAKAAEAARAGDSQVQLQEASAQIGEDDFRKIVDEVVDNAFKFSESGSPVRVEMVQNQGQVRILVADCGRGLTPEEVASIGAHTQFKRRLYEQQGAGLGLIIAKRLTEMRGGKFTIRSVPGEGSSIQLEFPGAG